jgi:acyl-coenzyme A thioesterase PaaI-like protein
MSESRVLAMFRRYARNAPGRWLFTRLVCRQAPYFASIHPLIEDLAPGRCVVRVKKRKSITNHIGTVHAIAQCNMAEMVGGLSTEVSIPGAMRWIPKGMTVEYLKRADGVLRATAHIEPLPPVKDTGYDLVVPVEIKDANDQLVFRAAITMWITPRNKV